MQRILISWITGAELVLLLTVVSATAGFAVAGEIELPAETSIEIQFDQDAKITSGNQVAGDTIVCHLASAVEMGDVEILRIGTPCKAEVTEVEKSGKVGKPGYIKLSFVELETDGPFRTAKAEPIPLQGEIEAKGKGKKVLSLILGFGLIIKGGQGEVITKETVYKAMTTEAVRLTSD